VLISYFFHSQHPSKNPRTFYHLHRYSVNIWSFIQACSEIIHYLICMIIRDDEQYIGWLFTLFFFDLTATLNGS